MRALLALLVGSTAGLVLARAPERTDVSSPPAPTASPVERDAAPSAGAMPVDPHGNGIATVRAQLQPSAVSDASEGESLGARVEIATSLPAAATVWTLEVVDDMGVEHHAARGEPTPAGPDGTRVDDVVAIPPGLPDGFYRARLTVAARSDVTANADSAEDILYVEVVDGAVVPIDVEEFLQRSAANAAITEVSR